MEGLENTHEPRMVSYLDVLVYGTDNKRISKNIVKELEESGLKDIIALPDIPKEEVDIILHELGVDLTRDVEERWCLHRPTCLKQGSKRDDTPQIYGKAYFGYLRRDKEFKKYCIDNNIVL